MDKEDIDIEADIADTVMERPIGFTADGRRFFLYPPTLGKSYLVSRLTEALGIDRRLLAANPYMEALRLCAVERETVCRILAYHTLNRREDILDEDKVSEACGFLSERLDGAELARLLVLALTRGDAERYARHFGLDRERAERQRIARMKREKGNDWAAFGCRSVYGSLIDFACHRYGWTFDYVVWGVSHANLLMLLADCETTVYLSAEERGRLGMRGDGEFIDGDDPGNADKIRAMLRG